MPTNRTNLNLPLSDLLEHEEIMNDSANSYFDDEAEYRVIIDTDGRGNWRNILLEMALTDYYKEEN